ncbi:MAG: translesion error-prone DNA polymerase V autoproteolytic subunit [Proteobacteria bacterium]|nr:translesion error-prone DNA polymerase V autoproteolytic subunit [Pseudomonadota bacterium]
MTKKTTTNTRPLKLLRGGKREGAGRPHGTGKYGEPTKAIRVPQSLVHGLQQFLTDYGQGKVNALSSYMQPTSAPVLRLPLFSTKVAAGFPSPADDHFEAQLDLNEYVIKNPASTFYVRVEGNSMLGAGIHPSDLLVVDLSLEPRDGNVVIAIVNGEFTVKRLQITKNNVVSLHPENDMYPVITIKEDMEFRIWGVVTNVIHSFI